MTNPINGISASTLITDDHESRALTQVEKDRLRGSKRRRKPVKPENMQARLDGLQKIYNLLNRANPKIDCSEQTILRTAFNKGL